MNEIPSYIKYLRSPEAIRERAQAMLALGEKDSLHHFRYHGDKLDEVADIVVEVTKNEYPDLKIPYHSRWQHFNVGGIQRLGWLEDDLAKISQEDRGVALYDLVILSVLLDAGAGPNWKFRENNKDFQRSEGLAVASLHMFKNGLFSRDPKNTPLRADCEILMNLKEDSLGAEFQVGEDNPLLGLEGRLGLVNMLGEAIRKHPKVFGSESPRPGTLFKYFLEQSRNNQLSAKTIFSTLIETFGDIWPNRLEIDGYNLGDCWRYPNLGGEGKSKDIIPFHKLTQWLTYSLFEPLEEMGIEVTEIPKLTGLAEYRNGGLLIDSGLITLKSADDGGKIFKPDHQLIVEWRGLTVSLLDIIGERVRDKLGFSEGEFPLVKVLQGGTWTAGRKLAKKFRPDGSPPVKLDTNGTVF